MEGEEIGEGTFGKVSVEDGKAVKLFKAADDEDRFENTDESFIHEISSYLRLNGKLNIVSMDSYSSNPYIVRMKLYNESLNVYLDKKKSYLSKAKIAYDILIGLHNQFTVGILHGDIKPSNIFLTNRGAVIGDYGLAQYKSVAPVNMNWYIYTIYQRPPECIQEDPIIDLAADMWAYGILLLEIFLDNEDFPSIVTAEDIHEWHRAIAIDGRPSRNSTKYLNLKDMVNKGMLTSHEYNLVSRVLYIDPRKRANPVELSSDPYFAGFRPINFVTSKLSVIPKYTSMTSVYSQSIIDNMYALDKTLVRVATADVLSINTLQKLYDSTVTKFILNRDINDVMLADTIISFGYLMQFIEPKKPGDYMLLLYIVSRVIYQDARGNYFPLFPPDIDIASIKRIMTAIGSGFSVFPLRILYHEMYKRGGFDILRSQRKLYNYISRMKHIRVPLQDIIEACLVEKQ